jgi:uncharacterized protein
LCGKLEIQYMFIQELIGREPEILSLNEATTSPRAELIAVYGRRRVGKTFLIRTVYEQNIVFELTGLKDANLTAQLENFSDTLADTFKPPIPLERPTKWMQAFRQLIHFIEADIREEKKVIFLDEFPWLDTPKSGFLQAFDHFWNNWASRKSNLIVVICGSAASWMIHNIVRNKGGLHNRLTRRIRLSPFNLYETERFLKKQGVVLERYQILELYMALGGIPQYLMDVKPGESPMQTIDRLCFTNEGWLRHEFQDLYPALFDNAEKHLEVVRALGEKPYGMTRTDIMDACSTTTGGTITNVLNELLQSGFISDYVPFGKTSRDVIYKLSDEYSLFYLKFIENSKSMGSGTWLSKSTSASYTVWCGFAFEHICLKHIPQIKKALGIAAVYTEHSIWRYKPKASEETGGAQIDLLFDRNDRCINLIEIKFSVKGFTIDKKYAEELRHKRWIFMEKTQTKKSVFLTMMTTFGVKTNEHYLSAVQNQIMMPALFEPL